MILNPANHWKLGLLAVTGLSLGVGAVAFFGADRLARESFEVVTYFSESVEGLDEGSPVKFRGVTLGRVQEISFAPNREDVAVTSEIFYDTVEKLELLDSMPTISTGLGLENDRMRFQLTRSGITGIAFLEADVFEADEIPVVEYDFQLPWNHIPSTESTLASLESTLSETLEELPRLLRATEAFVGRLDQKVAELDLVRLDNETRATLEAVQGMAADLRALEAPALAADLRSAIDEARAVVSTAGSVLSEAQPAVADVRALSDAARDELATTGAAVREAALGVDELGLEGQALVRSLRGDLGDLGQTLEAIRRLAELLERDPGALLRGRGE